MRNVQVVALVGLGLGLLLACDDVGAVGVGSDCSGNDQANCLEIDQSSADSRKLVSCRNGKLELVEDCAAKGLVCTAKFDGSRFVDGCATKEEYCKADISPRPSICN